MILDLERLASMPAATSEAVPSPKSSHMARKFSVNPAPSQPRRKLKTAMEARTTIEIVVRKDLITSDDNEVAPGSHQTKNLDRD